MEARESTFVRKWRVHSVEQFACFRSFVLVVLFRDGAGRSPIIETGIPC
jgi:hypothetical protein